MPLGCLTPSQTGWLWVPSAASWGLSPATCWCGLGLEMPRKGWEESLQEELGVGVGGGRATFQRTEAGAEGGRYGQLWVPQEGQARPAEGWRLELQAGVGPEVPGG